MQTVRCLQQSSGQRNPNPVALVNYIECLWNTVHFVLQVMDKRLMEMRRDMALLDEKVTMLLKWTPASLHNEGTDCKEN